LNYWGSLLTNSSSKGQEIVAIAQESGSWYYVLLTYLVTDLSCDEPNGYFAKEYH